MAVITRLERKSCRWEQVWQSESETVATIVAGRLEAEGLRVRVTGDSTPYRATFGQLGGAWAIHVLAGSAERARAILRENDEGHNLIEREDATSLTATQRATLRFAILALAAFAVVIAALSVFGSR